MEKRMKDKGVNQMVRNRKFSNNQPSEVKMPQEMSLEQKKHLKENQRHEEPIDHRKTDGSNIPSI
jgi:hypothetical protein